MTTQQSRPDLTGIETAADAYDTPILDAEHAHLFGIGMSQTERAALNRRGLASLREVWPAVLERMLRRFLQDAIASQLPGVTLKRAEELERVGTPWADAAAKALRRRAWLQATCGPTDDVMADVDAFLTSQGV